jgi:hypothetical protein
MSAVLPRQVFVEADHPRGPRRKLAHHHGCDEHDLINLLRGSIDYLRNIPKLKSRLTSYENVAVYPRPKYRLQSPLQLLRLERSFVIKLDYTTAQNLDKNPPNILFIWSARAGFCDPNRQADCGVGTMDHNQGEHGKDRCERSGCRFHPHQHFKVGHRNGSSCFELSRPKAA